DIPLGTFVCVTGVSGSGKSTLVNEILYKALAQQLHGAGEKPGAHDRIEGVEHLDRVIDIDQSPIGRTPRSNPATYTNLFNDIRTLFAATSDAKIRGYSAGRFSFNVKGGRCEACQGDGIVKIEMHFLSDVYVPCEVCGGKRYNRETLEVKYKGKSISDVLDMTIDESVEFFSAVPKIYNRCKKMQEVGLGYVKLGQPATTLSGGEAQRVKLATELSKRSTGKTIYILDEPTTGLHSADVHKLIDVLQELVDQGNTVLVIEHNLDVVKNADYIIDLGPDGGDNGGTVVATGTPEQVAKTKGSYTGEYLKKML
ncbi:MAG: ATP-binding cassette domain-containing protein, partial [Clostridiales bacterium]|nr:ATP-binding cassette domain-containing protein [Clostridiales bacterium]